MPPKLSSVRNLVNSKMPGKTKDPTPAGPVKGQTTGKPANGVKRPGQG